jgi:hypothetical protein
MKTIQPIQLWNEGIIDNATLFDMYISYDNLESQAVFYYHLMNDQFENLASGKLQMTEEEYIVWDNSNDGAYLYGSKKLNLTITGDYVPPVTEEVIS